MLQNFNMRASMIGSLPHLDPTKAVNVVKNYLEDAPVWPQLTHKDPRENMIAQAINKLTGITYDGDKYVFDLACCDMEKLEVLITNAITDNCTDSALEPYEASGLFEFNKTPDFKKDALITGHICGPITAGLSIVDTSGKQIIYDETAMDLLTKHLKLKTKWLEKELHKISDNTLVVLDEPSISAFGSGFFNFDADQASSILCEVQSGCEGLTGVHCCAETYWPLIFNTKCNVISLDAYNFAMKLEMYIDEINTFYEKGGSIAWGIVPTNAKEIHANTIDSLKDKLIATLNYLINKGLKSEYIYHNGLITPACGLSQLTEDDAELALSMCHDLAEVMQKNVF